MPDIGADAIHTMEASIKIAADITKLSKEVMLAILKAIRDQLNKGMVPLKRLNREAAKSGVTLSSVSVPNKDAQSIIEDLQKAGVTFALKREGDGIRVFFYAPSTEVIKTALEEAIRKHEQEQDAQTVSQEQTKETVEQAKEQTQQQEPVPQQEVHEEQPQQEQTVEQTQEEVSQQPVQEQTAEQAQEEVPPQPIHEEQSVEQPQQEQPAQTQEPQPDAPETKPPTMEQEPEKEYVPLYLFSAGYARAHGEQAAFRVSMQENIACRNAIEQAITEGYVDNKLAQNISHKLIDEYGAKRVAYVLAATVVQMTYDGRISRATKEWAKQEIPDPNSSFENMRVRSHPGLLEIFITDAREYMAQAREQVHEAVGKVVQAAVSFPENAKIMREGEEAIPNDAPKEEPREKAGEEPKAAQAPPVQEAAAEPMKSTTPQPFEALLGEGIRLAAAHNARFAKDRSQPERKEPSR